MTFNPEMARAAIAHEACLARKGYRKPLVFISFARGVTYQEPGLTPIYNQSFRIFEYLLKRAP